VRDQGHDQRRPDLRWPPPHGSRVAFEELGFRRFDIRAELHPLESSVVDVALGSHPAHFPGLCPRTLKAIARGRLTSQGVGRGDNSGGHASESMPRVGVRFGSAPPQTQSFWTSTNGEAAEQRSGARRRGGPSQRPVQGRRARPRHAARGAGAAPDRGVAQIRPRDQQSVPSCSPSPIESSLDLA
jgi:hypothetical protein